MAIAQIIHTSNPNIVYRETDGLLYNLLPNLQQFYGTKPIIFWKYNISNPQRWVVSEDENYIIGKKGQPTKETNPTFASDKKSTTLTYVNPTQSSVVSMIANIGPTGRSSKYCGTLTKTFSDSEFRDFNTLLTGNEVPRIIRRGVISQVVPGDEGRDAYVFNQSRTIQLDRNASAQEVLNAWNAYLANARNNKPDTSKNLYFVNQRTGNQEEIKTFAQFQQLFPKYYQFEKQFEQEALTSLVAHENPVKIFVDGQWWDVDSNYINLWNKFANTGLSDQAITRELLDIGYTMSQINTIRGVRGVTMAELKEISSGSSSDSGGGSGGSAGGSSPAGGRSANGSVWKGPEGYTEGRVQDITVQRSKNIFFTSEEITGVLSNRGVSIDNSKPVMYQVYRGSDANAQTGSALINEYVFDVIPNEINYGGFGGEWVSIDRVGGFPFIDWKSFKLLQISFSFTIADKDSGVFTGDGLLISVKDKIEKLQRMAQTPYPVMFYGFDTLLTNQFRYDDNGAPRGVQFVIQDLSITAARRDVNMQITRATANITLQEIPIEKTSIIGMPRLKHVPKKPDEPTTFTDPEYGKTTDNLNRKPDQDIQYPNPP
jgi:uncharacterized membrane protein YgcG